MKDCLFCRIIAGEIPSAKVYEDSLVYAFRDITPQAPVHVLVIPKAHASGMADIAQLDDATLSACLRACRTAARLEGLTSYRVISNCGPDACQSVGHLHFHVLGGRQMTETMA